MNSNNENTSLNKTANSSESVLGFGLFAFFFSFIAITMAAGWLLREFGFLLTGTYLAHIQLILNAGPFEWADQHIAAQGGGWLYYIVYYGIVTVNILLPIIMGIFTGIWCQNNEGVETLTKGIQVITNTKTALKFAREQLAEATGFHVHKELRINREQEVAHTLVWGATRSGKSQTLAWVLEDIFQQKERAAVFDIKGDLVGRMYGKPGVMLLNPADKRSIYWDIASDLKTASDARIFAAGLLPKNPKDTQPMFADNARSILSGLIIFLLSTKPKTWDWVDFARICGERAAVQKKLLASVSHPDCSSAAKLIALEASGEPNKQTASVLSTMAPATSTLNQIAAWWGRRADSKRLFKLTDWVKNPNQKHHFLIMAATADRINTEYGALYSVFYSILINAGCGPNIEQNNGSRLYVVIDELAIFPKIEGLIQLVSLGAGFGLSFIGGIQDISGLSSYSDKELNTFLSNINTMIIGKLNDPETARHAMSLFGTHRVERVSISSSAQGTSTSFSESDHSALVDSDFLNLPKASLENGYEMFLRTDSNGAPIRVKLHYDVIPRRGSKPGFIPVLPDDEFAAPIAPVLPQQTQHVSKLNTREQEEEVTETRTITTVTTDDGKAKVAAAVIGGNAALDVVEDSAIEAIEEVADIGTGTHDTISALQHALDLADLLEDAIASNAAVSVNTTSEQITESQGKRLSFKRKRSAESEEEYEAE